MAVPWPNRTVWKKMNVNEAKDISQDLSKRNKVISAYLCGKKACNTELKIN